MSDKITDWLSILSGLLNPMMPGDALEILMTYKPHIKAEFSPSHLTDASARAVAAARRYGTIPSWDVVANSLRDYARSTRPFAAALPAPREPDREPPSEAEIRAVGDVLAAWRQGRPTGADNPLGAPMKMRNATIPPGVLKLCRCRDLRLPMPVRRGRV